MSTFLHLMAATRRGESLGTAVEPSFERLYDERSEVRIEAQQGIALTAPLRPGSGLIERLETHLPKLLSDFRSGEVSGVHAHGLRALFRHGSAGARNEIEREMREALKNEDLCPSAIGSLFNFASIAGRCPAALDVLRTEIADGDTKFKAMVLRCLACVLQADHMVADGIRGLLDTALAAAFEISNTDEGRHPSLELFSTVFTHGTPDDQRHLFEGLRERGGHRLGSFVLTLEWMRSAVEHKGEPDLIKNVTSLLPRYEREIAEGMRCSGFSGIISLPIGTLIEKGVAANLWSDVEQLVGVVRARLEEVGLPADDLIQCSGTEISGAWWRDHFGEIGFANALAKHLWQIALVEDAQPGGARELHDRVGIRYFGRYPSTTLAEQVTLMRRPPAPASTEPYIAVLCSAYDHNGAFFGSHEMMVHLKREADRVGVPLLVGEFDGRWELIQSARELRKHFGLAAAAIVGGHASGDKIWCGAEDAIGAEELGHPSYRRIVGRILRPRAVLIHDSCSVMREGDGFAHREARKLEDLELVYVGPDRPSGLRRVAMERRGAELDLVATFGSDAKTIVIDTRRRSPQQISGRDGGL